MALILLRSPKRSLSSKGSALHHSRQPLIRERPSDHTERSRSLGRTFHASCTPTPELQGHVFSRPGVTSNAHRARETFAAAHRLLLLLTDPPLKAVLAQPADSSQQAHGLSDAREAFQCPIHLPAVARDVATAVVTAYGCPRFWYSLIFCRKTKAAHWILIQGIEKMDWINFVLPHVHTVDLCNPHIKIRPAFHSSTTRSVACLKESGPRRSPSRHDSHSPHADPFTLH